MKVRNVQFGERKNPDSSRVHGLRLAVSSLPVESVAESQETNARELASPSIPHEVRMPRLSPKSLLNEAKGETVTGRGRPLTIQEVAGLLHVPVSWVYGRTRKRSLERLPGYRIGKYWRFREDEIHQWVKRQGGGPGAA
jgi:excisionase family DNA binding protein